MNNVTRQNIWYENIPTPRQTICNEEFHSRPVNVENV